MFLASPSMSLLTLIEIPGMKLRQRQQVPFTCPNILVANKGLIFYSGIYLHGLLICWGFFVCFNGSCCCCEDMPSTILLILRQFA